MSRAERISRVADGDRYRSNLGSIDWSKKLGGVAKQGGSLRTTRTGQDGCSASGARQDKRGN